MESILYFILTIGILVFVHEFGHFAAAKLSGMRAEIFAIGFGYRLFGYNKVSGFTFGELPKDFEYGDFTDYRLCLLPLGGYVKIAGMVDESFDTKLSSSEAQPWEFRSKDPFRKAFVISAGVIMNLLLAFVIFWGNNVFYGKTFSKTTTIAYVEEGSKAAELGFRAGDAVLKVNGRTTLFWEDFRNELNLSGLGENLKVIVKGTDHTEREIYIPKNSISGEQVASFVVPAGFKPMIGDILKKSAADSAGFKIGDVLISLNGTDLYSVPQTMKIISSSIQQKIDAKILRGEDTVTVAVTPGKDGKIGIMLGQYAFLGETKQITHGAGESVSLAISDIKSMTVMTFTMMSRVFSGEVAFGKAFGGPVKIAKYAAKSADNGLSSFLMFLGLLSLSLAILNILPFPVLDGGHLVIIIVEALIAREIPLNIKMGIQKVGFGLLLMLMAFILYNDIWGK